MAPASIPPLLERFTTWFDHSPVAASLVALALAVVAIALLRMALKFFLVFLVVMMVVILGSYLFMGEEETGEVIKDNVYEITDPPPAGEADPDAETEQVPAVVAPGENPPAGSSNPNPEGSEPAVEGTEGG